MTRNVAPSARIAHPAPIVTTQDTGDRWPSHRRYRGGGLNQRVGLVQVISRHDVRHKTTRCRRENRTANALSRAQDRDEDDGGMRCDQTGAENHFTQPAEAVGAHHQAAPRETVGDYTANQEECDLS